ncbi:MAG TPA: hypothetical protein DCQ37_08595 [Desulfobacteraceae bacterium]|nr:hypothetical protein [Desulfobacteraceae bacterium]
MKTLGDLLLRHEPFSEIVMGNTAIVRAMIEAGTQVVSSYPGSPTPEIAEAIKSIPKAKRPFYFEFSTNEKVAAEVAYGAAVNGHLSAVFFKSMGLNVAADTCGNCQTPLKHAPVIAYDRRQVSDIPPIRTEITGHQIEILRCPECGHHNNAWFPAEVSRSVQYGFRVKSQSVYFNNYSNPK